MCNWVVQTPICEISVQNPLADITWQFKKSKWRLFGSNLCVQFFHFCSLPENFIGNRASWAQTLAASVWAYEARSVLSASWKENTRQCWGWLFVQRSYLQNILQGRFPFASIQNSVPHRKSVWCFSVNNLSKDVPKVIQQAFQVHIVYNSDFGISTWSR